VIIDLRTYTVAPGKIAAYLELYEREGYPIHCRHQGEPVGYFVSEIGTLTPVVHLWKYESMADRERRRAGLESDPDWISFRKKSAEGQYLVHQENRILKSTKFSPL